jgi:hypothetical protein
MNHDQNFKNLIVDYPLAALRLFAGEEGELPGQDLRITPLRQEQLQERLGGRYRELDIPLQVEWGNGERAGLLFVVETESRADRFSIHRLVHYCVDLAEMLKTDRVVPVVIFLDGRPQATGLRLGGERGVYLDFHYIRCDLHRLRAEEFWGSDNVVARITLPQMSYREDQRVEIYARAVSGLLAYEPDPRRQEKYAELIDQYASLSEAEQNQYRQRYPEEAKTMGGFFQRAREEGMQQGMQQGEAAVLLRLIRRKYGSDTAASYREQIEQADSDTLLEWSERLLTAEKAEEIFH